MSDNELDLDAEILGMVGDDSSDSEGSEAGDDVPTTQSISHRTPSEEPKQSVEKVEEPPSARRGVAQKVRRKGGKRKVNKRELEDELDDLADSPSPAASLGSDAMLESNASSPAPRSVSPADDGPAYPLEGVYLDSADRAHIQSLPEIQREEILAERAAENTKRQQDLQLKKALAATQAAASKQQKRKAAAADLDDDAGQRKSSRAKVEKRSVLDDYKKAREARGADRTSRLDPRRDRDRKRRSRSASSASDRDADGESEVEWATEVSRRDEPAAELKDFERCRVGRTNFAKVCFYPNFEETMKGCFARVSIGVNRETDENMYRMTQIKGFKQGKPYTLDLPTGKTFTTDQYAIVAHGTAEKPWPFSACSDSRFTQAEFDKYTDTISKEHLCIPKRNWLHQKLDDIHKFLNVEWTDTVLAGKFARQREMEKRVDPANAAKVKKEGILTRKAEAEKAEDFEEANRCDAELAALENNALSSNGTAITSRPSPLKPKPAVPETQQDRLALLNQRNRGKNANDVRQALIEERRKRERAIAEARAVAEAKAKAEAEAKAEAKEAAPSVEGGAKDGLLAVPGGSKAMMRELFGDSPSTSRAGTPFSGAGTPGLRRSRAGTPVNGGLKGKSGLGVVAMKNEEEDMGVDLGIDVEI